MNKVRLILSIALLAFPLVASAETNVIEGDEAAKLYQAAQEEK